MQGSYDLPTDEDIRILDAHGYFSERIREWFATDQDMVKEKYQAFFETLTGLLQLVVIELDDHVDPQLIFETLNARGTPLSQSDLVKNWISHQAQISGSDEEKFHNEHLSYFEDSENWWDTVVPQGRIRRSRIDQFFNYWLAMRTAKEVLVGNVFSDFQNYAKGEMEDNSTIEDIVVDIRMIADIYKDIEQGKFDEPLHSFVDKKNILQAGVLMPPLLWMISSKLDPKVMNRSLKALESFFVRRALCGNSTMGLNRLMLELLARLNDHDASSKVDDVLVDFLRGQDAPRRVWPTDGDLRDAFQQRRQFGVMAQRKLVMVLSALDREIASGFAEVMNFNLSIEHVMPRKWSSHWSGPSDPERSPAEATARRNRLIHTMGNLTLVTKPLNSSVSNGPWTKKRAALDEHSTLFLNKDLLKHAPEGSQWDEDAILARGQRLYEAALKVWPGPDAI